MKANDIEYSLFFLSKGRVNGLTEWAETLTIQVVMQAVAQRRRAGMENRREEFLKTVCQIYMAAVLVVLPLYYIPGNGYDKLGDSKYYLYRNISLICLGICLAVQIIAVVRSCQIEEQMMYNTYNMGSGMVVAVDPTDVDKTMKAIEAAGETAYVIGEIENGEKGVTLC